uniref:Uncharacterized protein n=1 Tax=Timema bartmani TaxID=61472 RepID=A0A7R9EQX9_9NEOP|nr:unnamed protein product [Timema bartmani]
MKEATLAISEGELDFESAIRKIEASELNSYLTDSTAQPFTTPKMSDTDFGSGTNVDSNVQDKSEPETKNEVQDQTTICPQKDKQDPILSTEKGNDSLKEIDKVDKVESEIQEEKENEDNEEEVDLPDSFFDDLGDAFLESFDVVDSCHSSNEGYLTDDSSATVKLPDNDERNLAKKNTEKSNSSKQRLNITHSLDSKSSNDNKHNQNKVPPQGKNETNKNDRKNRDLYESDLSRDRKSSKREKRMSSFDTKQSYNVDGKQNSRITSSRTLGRSVIPFRSKSTRSNSKTRQSRSKNIISKSRRRRSRTRSKDRSSRRRNRSPVERRARSRNKSPKKSENQKDNKSNSEKNNISEEKITQANAVNQDIGAIDISMQTVNSKGNNEPITPVLLPPGTEDDIVPPGEEPLLIGKLEEEKSQQKQKIVIPLESKDKDSVVKTNKENQTSSPILEKTTKKNENIKPLLSSPASGEAVAWEKFRKSWLDAYYRSRGPPKISLAPSPDDRDAYEERQWQEDEMVNENLRKEIEELGNENLRKEIEELGTSLRQRRQSESPSRVRHSDTSEDEYDRDIRRFKYLRELERSRQRDLSEERLDRTRQRDFSEERLDRTRRVRHHTLARAVEDVIAIAAEVEVAVEVEVARIRLSVRCPDLVPLTLAGIKEGLVKYHQKGKENDHHFGKKLPESWPKSNQQQTCLFHLNQIQELDLRTCRIISSTHHPQVMGGMVYPPSDSYQAPTMEYQGPPPVPSAAPLYPPPYYMSGIPPPSGSLAPNIQLPIIPMGQIPRPVPPPLYSCPPPSLPSTLISPKPQNTDPSQSFKHSPESSSLTSILEASMKGQKSYDITLTFKLGTRVEQNIEQNMFVNISNRASESYPKTPATVVACEKVSQQELQECTSGDFIPSQSGGQVTSSRVVVLPSELLVSTCNRWLSTEPANVSVGGIKKDQQLTVDPELITRCENAIKILQADGVIYIIPLGQFIHRPRSSESQGPLNNDVVNRSPLLQESDVFFKVSIPPQRQNPSQLRIATKRLNSTVKTVTPTPHLQIEEDAVPKPCVEVEKVDVAVGPDESCLYASLESAPQKQTEKIKMIQISTQTKKCFGRTVEIQVSVEDDNLIGSFRVVTRRRNRVQNRNQSPSEFNDGGDCDAEQATESTTNNQIVCSSSPYTQISSTPSQS